MAGKFASMEMDLVLDPAGIASPTLVFGADDDIVHLSHTIGMYQASMTMSLPKLTGSGQRGLQ
jgi:hypothetical protein